MTSPGRFLLGMTTQTEQREPGYTPENDPSLPAETQAVQSGSLQQEASVYQIRGNQVLQRLLPDQQQFTTEQVLQEARQAFTGANAQNMEGFNDGLQLLATLSYSVVSSGAAQQSGELIGQIQTLLTQGLNQLLEILDNNADNLRMNAEQALDLRGQARMMFDVMLNSGFIFHLNQDPSRQEPQQRLLQRIHATTQRLFDQHQGTEGSRQFSDYFGHFLRAQGAILSQNQNEAFNALVDTRESLLALNQARPNYTPNGIRDQIGRSVDAGLSQMAQDQSAQLAQNARTRISFNAMSAIYLGEQINEDMDEGTRNQVVHRVQQFQIFSDLLLNDPRFQALSMLVLQSNTLSSNATETLQSVNQISARLLEIQGEERQQLIQALQALYGENENFQQALGRFGLDTENPAEMWPQLFQNVQNVASYLAEHSGDATYGLILSHDRRNRPLTQAAEILDNSDNEMLRFNIARALGLPGSVEGRVLATHMANHGPHLQYLLETMIDEVSRGQDNYRDLWQHLQQAIHGLSEAGIQDNFQSPVVELLASLAAHAEDEEHAAQVPGIVYFARELQQVEHLAPEIAMPARVRNRAARLVENLDGFSWTRIWNHTASWEFFGLTLAGIGMAQIAEIGMLRWAGGVNGTLGRGALTLVEGGALNMRGQLALGFAVAGGMNFASHSVNSIQHEDYQFWSGENWYRMATGTLFAGAAIGLSMAGTHFARARMGIGNGVNPTFWQSRALDGISIGLGGSAMYGAGMLNQRYHQGEWGSFNAEQFTEMMITMGAFHYGSMATRAALSRPWGAPRSLIGTHRMSVVRDAADSILETRPGLFGSNSASPEANRAWLERQLASRYLRGQWADVADNVDRGYYPEIVGNRSRSLEFISHQQRIAIEGEQIQRSRTFRQDMRTLLSEARDIFSRADQRQASPRNRQQALERVYVIAEREGQNVTFHEPRLGTGGQEHMRFVIDREGRLHEVEQIRDPILRNALERVQLDRGDPTPTPDAESEVGVETDIRNRADLIAADPTDPMHEALRHAFRAARDGIQAQLQAGIENPEVFLKIERNRNSIDWEILPEGARPTARERALRIDQNGYEPAEIDRLFADDPLTSGLLDLLRLNFFRTPIVAPRRSGNDDSTATVSDARRTQETTMARLGGRPRSAPAHEPALLPATTNPIELAQRILERYPRLTRVQAQEALALIGQGSQFFEGLHRVRLEIASTTGSQANHPTINVYRTESGEFHFMVEGNPPPAGEPWGNFQIALGQHRNAQSTDPVFSLVIEEGLVGGRPVLDSLVQLLRTPTPPPPPVPEASGEGEAMGETTAPQEPSPELVSRSRPRRRRRPEATQVVRTGDPAQTRLRRQSAEGRRPATDEVIEEVDLADVELVSETPEAQGPISVRPTTRPGESSPSPRIPPIPPAPRVPTIAAEASSQPPPLPPRAARVEEPFLLTVRRRATNHPEILPDPAPGLDPTDTAIFQTSLTQRQIDELVNLIQEQRAPELRSGQNASDELYVVFNPDGSSSGEPSFQILSEGFARSIVRDTNNPAGYIRLRRVFDWSESNGGHRDPHVSFEGSEGVLDPIVNVLRQIFAE